MRDMIVDYLKKLGLPVTRENYVKTNWMGDLDPKMPLSAELEASLPKDLQAKNKKEELQ